MKKITLCILLFFIPIVAFSSNISQFKIEDNSILSSKSIKIDGNFDFFWGRFVPLSQQDVQPDYIVKKASSWHTYNLPSNIDEVYKTGAGCGTYRIKITNLKPFTKYSIPTYKLCYTAFKLYANDELIFQSGSPNEDWSKTILNETVDYATFKTDATSEIILTFFVSNNVYRKAGLMRSVELMEEKIALESFYKNTWCYSILCGILFTIVAYGFLLFVVKKEKSTFYLSVFILTILLRVMFESFPLVKYFIPDFPVPLMFKIEFTSLFMAPAYYTLYINSMNPKILGKVKTYIIVFFALILLVLDFHLPLIIVNRLVPIMQFYLFTVIYTNVLFLIVTIIKDKDFISLSAILTFLIIGFAALFDILKINNIIAFIPFSLLPLSFVIYSIAQIILFAYIQNEDIKRLIRLNSYLTQTNKAYYRFVPREFLDFLNRKDITEVEVGEYKVSKMAILSADIRNFTSISEKMNEENLFDMLNSYLKIVAPIIRKYDGFIEKYLGDGIIAVFPNSAEKALLCSIEMQEKMLLLRDDFKKRGLPLIRIGVGVHYGTVIIGTGGNENRMTEISLSDDIDIAVKTEASTKLFMHPVIVTKQVLENAAVEAKEENRNFSFCGKKIKAENISDLFFIYNNKIGTSL